MSNEEDGSELAMCIILEICNSLVSPLTGGLLLK